jgi:hypothetical protein
MQISENSRIWIYQADRNLNSAETKQIQQTLDSFTQTWDAHGNTLSAAAEVRHQRFIILAVDEEKAGVSGCSIDKSVALMKQLESEFGIQLFDRLSIAYRDGEQIKTFRKADFAKLMDNGGINEDTIIFNNLVQTYAELENNWEITVKESWLSRIMPV